MLSFVWDWARSVLILSARPQPQTCKTIIIFKICSQDVNNNIPVLIKHDLDIVQWLDCQLLCTSRQYQSKWAVSAVQLLFFVFSFIGERPSTITGLTSFPSHLYPSCQHWSIIITPDPGSITRNFSTFYLSDLKISCKISFRPTTSPNGRTPDFCFSFSFPV